MPDRVNIYRQLAKENYGHDDDVEFEDDAKVYLADGGAWIVGLCWISDTDMMQREQELKA